VTASNDKLGNVVSIGAKYARHGSLVGNLNMITSNQGGWAERIFYLIVVCCALTVMTIKLQIKISRNGQSPNVSSTEKPVSANPEGSRHGGTLGGK